MRLNRIVVSGEIGCEYEFGDINVLLGDNNSGKSTLMKLILFLDAAIAATPAPGKETLDVDINL